MGSGSITGGNVVVQSGGTIAVAGGELSSFNNIFNDGGDVTVASGDTLASTPGNISNDSGGTITLSGGALSAWKHHRQFRWHDHRLRYVRECGHQQQQWHDRADRCFPTADSTLTNSASIVIGSWTPTLTATVSNGILNNSGGTITLSGGVLSDANGIVNNSGGAISGYGTAGYSGALRRGVARGFEQHARHSNRHNGGGGDYFL